VQDPVTPSGTEGNGDTLSGVSCSTPSACTAVGLVFRPFAPFPETPFTVAERWDGTGWSAQPTPNLPGAYDMATPALSCPTLSVCTAVGGFKNNGPAVTLTEQWHRDGSPALAGNSLTPASPRSIACTGPVASGLRTNGINPAHVSVLRAEHLSKFPGDQSGPRVPTPVYRNDHLNMAGLLIGAASCKR
jgi:hypothetical protein